MNMGMNWCSNNSGCLETVLSSLVRVGCRAKIEQFAKAQTTENHMMTTTNALTAVQENAGSSGCCFLKPSGQSLDFAYDQACHFHDQENL